jgi:uncharacterized cupin superfamily protein
MEHVTVDELDTFPHPLDATDGARALADALGTTDVAMNHYTLAPGEAPDGGYHTHLDQEEIFYVLEGTVTFDTDEGSQEVAAGEVVRFAPGDYHHGENDSDEQAIVLAIGAPGRRHDWDQLRVPVPCPNCEDVDAMGVDIAAGDQGGLRCPECDETMSV